ncbi:hypothetical protein MTR_3g068170 [Medicago truncatula]|uniref:Uncharacterized protein n=1 Tax=Medicago truncatula TaxID=3880 RepID=A0A072UYW0_MEDTR|nr:hypothetical protein MTR_3g068170 [Medicago truncatula]
MAENKCAPSPFSPNPTNESSNNNHMRIIPVEIPYGKDIIEVLTNFAQGCQADLIVFRGSGPISNITLLHPVHAASVVWVQATLFNKLEFCTEMPIDETLREIEEDDPINANGIINNIDHVAHESSNNNIVADMPDLNGSDDNSNQPN